MSRLYDTVEPAVIDDEMLRKAVEEQGPKEEAGRIAKQEGLDYKDILALRLDFRSKLKQTVYILTIHSMSLLCFLDIFTAANSSYDSQ